VAVNQLTQREMNVITCFFSEANSLYYVFAAENKNVKYKDTKVNKKSIMILRKGHSIYSLIKRSQFLDYT